MPLIVPAIERARFMLIALEPITPVGPEITLPNLTFGAWSIVNSIDEAGTDFSGSTLKFISQRESNSGLEATGFFEWRSGEQVLGREYIVANFDATSRQYRYRLFCDPIREPTRERFLWRVWPQVNGDLLHEVSQVFIGKNDFMSFGSAQTRGGSTVRTVLTSAWTRQNGEWQFQVRADAFLYRMVRRLVYLQVAVAQNRYAVTDLFDFGQRVAGEEYGATVTLHAAQLVIERISHERIERRGRLVENHQLRLVEERLDQTELLFVAARIRADPLADVKVECA